MPEGKCRNGTVFCELNEIDGGEITRVYAVGRAGGREVLVPSEVLELLGVLEVKEGGVVVCKELADRVYVAVYDERGEPLGAMNVGSGEGAAAPRLEDIEAAVQLWRRALSVARPPVEDISVEVRVFERDGKSFIEGVLRSGSKFLSVCVKCCERSSWDVTVNGLDGSLTPLIRLGERYGFTWNGDAYVRDWPMSRGEVARLAEDMRAALEEVKAQLAPRLGGVEWREVEGARRALGISVPACEKVPEAVVMTILLGEEEGRGGSGESSGEGVAREGVIPVSGFIVVSTLPSTALLDHHVPEFFKDTKIGVKLIQYVRGWFYNRLKSLSRKFYVQVLPRFAYETPIGYIVPPGRVEDFLGAVEKLRGEYEAYEKALKAFLLRGELPESGDRRARYDASYFQMVMEYLREHREEEAFRRRVEALEIASRFRVTLVPFSLDARALSALYELVDEKVRERIEREVEAVRRELAEKLKEGVREKCRELLERVAKMPLPVAINSLASLERELESIERDARELGVRASLSPKDVPELEELRKKVAELKVRGGRRVDGLLSWGQQPLQ
ncbi:MAG: hypothetical protein QXJ59_07465 [Thermofilaceae archaeon]